MTLFKQLLTIKDLTIIFIYYLSPKPGTVARSVEYLVRIDADPRVMATFGTFIRRLSLI